MDITTFELLLMGAYEKPCLWNKTAELTSYIFITELLKASNGLLNHIIVNQQLLLMLQHRSETMTPYFAEQLVLF
jgi:hypothetical protein